MGLVLGVFFAAFGVTGAALAFRPFLEERMYWPACAGCGAESEGPWDPVVTRLVDEGKRIAQVNLREGRAWEFVAQDRDGSNRMSVYVNPKADGVEISRRRHSDSPFSWIQELHTSLLLGNFGLQMAARLALLLLMHGALGLAVWWIRGFPVHTHALFGVTAGLVGILAGYSGWAVLTTRPAKIQPVVTLRGVENKVSVERIVRTAAARRPGRKLETVYFPAAPSQPYQFWFGDRPSNAAIVYMDPYGAILAMLIREQGHSIRDWHRGPAGGGGARVVRLLAGLGLLVLFVTGVRSFLLKRKSPGSEPTGVAA